jgi:ribosomal protein S18 acetylase RimI-like enzyme
MSPSTLLELSDLNYIEANRELARRGGGIVHDEDGLLLYAGAHALPVLVNGAIRTNPNLPAETVLTRARSFFAGRKRGYSILILAHSDADLRDAATAAGLHTMGDSPGMVLDHRLPAATPKPGVTLRRVTTQEDAKAFADVMGVAYGTYGMPPDVTPAILANLNVQQAPHIATFLAALDGKPAAGAMVIVTHGVAGIYWVGTIPDARGRGLAELCTRAAGNAGFDLGARIAALQASVMGEPVYRRMGYVEVTRYPYLVQLTPPDATAA